MLWCCCGDTPTVPEVVPAVAEWTLAEMMHKRAFCNSSGTISGAWQNFAGWCQKAVVPLSAMEPNYFFENPLNENWVLGPTLCAQFQFGQNDSENYPAGQLQVGYNCGLLSQSFNIPIGSTVAEATLNLTQDTRQPSPPAWPLHVAVFPEPDHHRFYFPAQFPWATGAYNNSPSFNGTAFQPYVASTMASSMSVNVTSQIQTVVSHPNWNTTNFGRDLRRNTSIMVLVWVPYRQSLWINNVRAQNHPSWPISNTAIWCADGNKVTYPTNCTLTIKV